MRENHNNEAAATLIGQPTLSDVAREEFWIVAKSFFAPIYGTLIVLRHLLKVTRQVDGKAPSLSDSAAEKKEDHWLIPAE